MAEFNSKFRFQADCSSGKRSPCSVRVMANSPLNTLRSKWTVDLYWISYFKTKDQEPRFSRTELELPGTNQSFKTPSESASWKPGGWMAGGVRAPKFGACLKFHTPNLRHAPTFRQDPGTRCPTIISDNIRAMQGPSDFNQVAILMITSLVISAHRWLQKRPQLPKVSPEITLAEHFVGEE